MAGMLALFAVVFLFVILFVVKKLDVPESSIFAGSGTCTACHKQEYSGWSHSLHPKMMQKAEEVSLDIKVLKSNPNQAFRPEDIKWVIGNKWERQFMGSDGETETLLPGAWLMETHEWKAVGWDGWKTPIPKRRCHGCHTVGLNGETGDFVEAGVGCESCHGKGGWHVKTFGLGKIYTGLESDICGQCHARGKSKQQKDFFFPINFEPGEKLEEYYQFSEPDPLQQNSSHWWGNGTERKRHQEYVAWQRGGHANSLTRLKEDYDGRYGEVENNCLTCHAGEAALADDKNIFALKDVEEGITCSVCHNVHGKLEELRMQCSSCHDRGAYHHQPDKNSRHVACGSKQNIPCVNCHMPLTVDNGGAYTLHSHAPGIIRPSDTLTYGVPNSCQNGGCHSTVSAEEMEVLYNRSYD